MTKQLTPQEADTLSAYLDNALNQRDRQRLETQLQARPELRAALNELRQTQTLLRQAPILRVPRNFTLTPEMVGLRSRPPRSYPVFQLAFALASIFFVFTVAGELAGGRLSPTAESVFMVESLAVEESAVQEAIPAEAGDTAQILPENERTSETPSTVTTEGEVVELAPTNSEAATPEMDIFQVAETPTLTPEAMTKSAPETEAVEEAPPQEEFPLEEPLPAEEFDSQLGNTEPAPNPNWWTSHWRLPQIIFGAAILISGLGLILRRRRTML